MLRSKSLGEMSFVVMRTRHRSRPILAVEILAVVAGLGQIFIGDRLVELLRSAFQCADGKLDR